MEKISVNAKIEASKSRVWECYTQPEHIVNWNFADPSWHCPSASNDLKEGGTYFARMEAKDGSFGFDFIATYKSVEMEQSLHYEFGGRESHVMFESDGNLTNITVTFDAEEENPVEMQKAGWQAILDNFAKYVQSNT